MAKLREELREHTRTAHQMAAEYREVDGTHHEAVTVDVSVGGAFFRSARPPRPGAKLPISLWPDARSETPIEALGEVRWTMDPGGRSSGGFGVRWLAAASTDAGTMRYYLQTVLGLSHGVVKVVPDAKSPSGKRYLYRFLKAVGEAAPEAPGVESGPPMGAADDQSVFLSANVQHGSFSVAGSVVGLTRDHVRVRVARGMPASFQRAQVHLLLDSSAGMLPIIFHGSVSFARPDAHRPDSGEFVLRITKMDEYGRKGLFAQYLSYLDKAA